MRIFKPFKDYRLLAGFLGSHSRLFAAVMIGMSVLLLSQCKKGGDNVAPGNGEESVVSIADIHHSECSHDDLMAKGYYDNDSVSVIYSDGVLHVTHHNMIVNCGIAMAKDGIFVDIVCDGDTITITESIDETLPQANCICMVDNMFDIVGLRPGTYTLVFANWYPEPKSFTFAF
ncbi:MAG: hypothetical protein IJR13_01150 [Bacteroidales bacterium]|nr:hypothetical protein [Bacteroidales bacterium]